MLADFDFGQTERCVPHSAMALAKILVRRTCMSLQLSPAEVTQSGYCAALKAALS